MRRLRSLCFGMTKSPSSLAPEAVPPSSQAPAKRRFAVLIREYAPLCLRRGPSLGESRGGWARIVRLGNSVSVLFGEARSNDGGNSKFEPRDLEPNSRPTSQTCRHVSLVAFEKLTKQRS